MDLSYCQWLRFHTVSTYPVFVDACVSSAVSSAIAIRLGDSDWLSLSTVKHQVKEVGMYHTTIMRW